jgi:hypothetical protein
MDRITAILIVCSIAAGGCGATHNGRSAEELAVEHIVQARLLESEGRWNEAATEYSMVADLYPESSYYETAVRKAAALYSHPGNDGATDSTALRWLQEYSALSLPEGERSMLEAHIRILEELKVTRYLLQSERVLTDSLSTLSRKQQDEIATGERQIRKLEADLERELAEAKKELERLREIDLEVGREKGKD